ncbi:MAG: hypothetical protein V7K40_01065 [Nostoc sp.]
MSWKARRCCWVGWFTISLPDILNGFLDNPSHGYDPRSNIKNIPKAIAHWHGLERSQR